MKVGLYYILLLFCLLSIVVVPLCIPSGGVTADSISYFRLANDLPEVKWSLFPLGYPVLLRVFNFIFNDFYWSGRILNILLFIVVAAFSYYKRFYFRATVVLLSTKIFFFNFYNSISEGLFLVSLYFLIYFLHSFFYNQKKMCKIFSSCSNIYGGLFYGALFYSVYFCRSITFLSFLLFKE